MSNSVKLYPPDRASAPASSPLPQLLQTPSGLALLELQGEFNLPQGPDGEPVSSVEVGRVHFPDFDAAAGPEDSEWMKRVHLYVGQHQRLTGEVKKLPRAVAVVRRREGGRVTQGSGGPVQEQGESLEVIEVVKYKLMFSNRPEPVGTANTQVP
jgi:chromosome transmission fidelity protein 8